VEPIAKLLGVSPGTLYNHIPELRELRAPALTRTRPCQIAPGNPATYQPRSQMWSPSA